ncbi:hypothetical protein K402DRAFT_393071 [Aulographum hederae CBS 113979]|uniref:Uncharacterized protein n=1 Tax=Aulographum hederae CBS 113979 TaxID=1176131 RepID=A0A6G1H2T1_9PEZI|nr:hypothetical protein K402DRAFT_393071 [Aulographum hederae CBS 113979]
MAGLAPSTSPPEDREWDEVRCSEALVRLEALQDQACFAHNASKYKMLTKPFPGRTSPIHHS